MKLREFNITDLSNLLLNSIFQTTRNTIQFNNGPKIVKISLIIYTGTLLSPSPIITHSVEYMAYLTG